MTTKYLIDTNILIYHTAGSRETTDFVSNIIAQKTFNISVLTKIEFLGWEKHTPDGFEKCKRLIESANIHAIGQDVADKAIDLKRERKIKLADAVIAATAIINNLKLVTRNTDDFKGVSELEVFNPFK